MTSLDPYKNSNYNKINQVGDFYDWTGLSHREEIVITGTHIKHTYFTYTEVPWCIPCHCLATVKRILLDCINLRNTKNKYYRNIKSMKNLFNENMLNVINYLKEVCLKSF